MGTLSEVIARLEEAKADWIDRQLSWDQLTIVLLVLAREIEQLKAGPPPPGHTTSFTGQWPWRM